MEHLSSEFADAINRFTPDFSPAAFWFWYGELNKKELARQMDLMTAQGIRQAFLHPRAYLKTPYLEEEWWDIMGYTLEYARQTGFIPWLYDEYAWPSGTAGSVFRYSSQKSSRVLAEDPRHRAKALIPEFGALRNGETLQELFQQDQNLICAVLYEEDEDGRIVTDSLRSYTRESHEPAGPEESPLFILFRLQILPEAVDYLNPDAIRSFIRHTHEEYRKRYSNLFGTVIPGIFFDEIFNAGSPLVWTEGFDREFSLRKGYDLRPLLPLLIREGTEDTARIRQDYYDVLAELYEEAFFKPISDWCRQNGLLLTGHTEEWLAEHPLRQGNYFKTMKHLQMPGADCHDYRYRYPRIISSVEPKGAVSVARLNKRKRIMSEAMGGGGWATTLQEFKRGINTLAALGINFFTLHGFSYETDHQGSQADWPVSFFFQNPYWRHFKLFADYIGRLSRLGAEGRPVCRVGLLYPLSSMRERFCGGESTGQGRILAEKYNSVLEILLSCQIDADIIDEDSIARAVIQEGQLRCGEEAFSLIVLPDISGPRDETLGILKDFENGGGKILLYDTEKETDDASLSSLFRSAAKPEFSDQSLAETVRRMIPVDLEITGPPCPEIRYYRRETEDSVFWLLANGSAKSLEITCLFRCTGTPVLYQPETGAAFQLSKDDWKTLDRRTECRLSFGPDEALCVYFRQDGQTVSDPEKSSGGSETECIMDLTDGCWTQLPVPSEDFSRSPGENPASFQRIELPLALFKAERDDKAFPIRIQNRAGEPGACGRHTSLWKAHWITRRPSWADDSCEKWIFFRKKAEIGSPVVSAEFCIAAVGNWKMHINGSLAASGGGWKEPSVVDVSSRFREGENVVAVSVENPTPLQGKNMLEAESVDPDALTSLLLEGRIETENGRVMLCSDGSWICCLDAPEHWVDPSYAPEKGAVKIDKEKITFPWGLENPAQWQYAWERGRPPLLPWGDLPYWGEEQDIPGLLEYTIFLPKGTRRIRIPRIQGSLCRLVLEGQDIEGKEGEYVDCGGEKGTEEERFFRIAVEAESREDGLKEPVVAEVESFPAVLGDWQPLGYDWYSGEMRYSREFEITAERMERRGTEVILDLGEVRHHAEVFVNGRCCGARIWPPYRFDISDFIQEGKNLLTVNVSNLAANKMKHALLDEGAALGWNRYWYGENISRDAENLVSGLIGPVRLERRGQ